jgi:hypothetical protein
MLGGVLVLELVLWMVAPLKFHEWLIWEADGHIMGHYMPGQEVDNAAGNKVRINKYGFRGPDYTYERPPGTLRLEVFGGSCAFEYFSSADDKTWPGALEKKLRERLKMPVEVINLALPGFDNFNGKINYLCNGRAFHPNAVIVYETFNDMGSRRFRTLETTPYTAMGTAPNRPWWMRLARNTQIGRRARLMLYYVQDRALEGKYRRIEGTEEGLDRPIHPKAFAWFRKNLEDFALLTRSDDVLLILGTQAYLGSRENLEKVEVRRILSIAPDRNGMTLARIADTYLKINEIIRDVAARTDSVFVDGYSAVPKDFDHLRDNVHLYDKGSEVLAEEFARVLLADPRFMKIVEQVRAEAGPGA